MEQRLVGLPSNRPQAPNPRPMDLTPGRLGFVSAPSPFPVLIRRFGHVLKADVVPQVGMRVCLSREEAALRMVQPHTLSNP